jgi:hypothetical protein
MDAATTLNVNILKTYRTGALIMPDMYFEREEK